MIGVFSINQKVVLQPNTNDKDLGYSKHQRLEGLTFTMHRKRPELSSRCLSQMI